MSVLDDLRAEAQDCLEIHVRIVPLVGAIVQDNEPFRAEVGVFNKGHTDIKNEQFIFRNVRLEVRPSIARILDESDDPVPLLKFELDDVVGNAWAGEGASFKSMAEFSWEEVYKTLQIDGPPPEESLFFIKVYADLDVSNYFADIRRSTIKFYDIKEN